jgi:multiple sugar transport system ATP-binding protein
VPTAIDLSQLELPHTPGALTDAVAEDAPHGVLRDRLARLVPHGQPAPPPATARTAYGFYPVYEPDDQPRPPALGGTLAVRIPVPAPVPRLGDRLALAVDLDRVFLFDAAGDRIRLDIPLEV